MYKIKIMPLITPVTVEENAMYFLFCSRGTHVIYTSIRTYTQKTVFVVLLWVKGDRQLYIKWIAREREGERLVNIYIYKRDRISPSHDRRTNCIVHERLERRRYIYVIMICRFLFSPCAAAYVIRVILLLLLCVFLLASSYVIVLNCSQRSSDLT